VLAAPGNRNVRSSPPETSAYSAIYIFTSASTSFASNNNAVKVGDYFRWDATVAYHLPKWDIRLNVLNIDAICLFLR